MRRWLLLVAALGLLCVAAQPARAQSTITVSNDQPKLEFPERLTFQADFKSDQPIEKVVLEYGVDQWTCGTVIAKAFPDIAPGKDVSAAWTWEMKQSGSQPPGSKIWWRWRLTDQQGQETVTNRKETVWLDNQHDWQTASGGNINLHWYDGQATFGDELHQSAVKSLEDLGKVTGLRTAKPIDLYIYANAADMRDAVLYEPGWTGGLAYADHNIVIIGISPDQIDWGKRTQAHELTHVLVGQLTFSCLSDIPTWLQEGLAVYGEGGPDGSSRQLFDQAVKDNMLLPVRALSGGFSEDPAKADVSYSQSYSLVNFLIDQYKQEKMIDLLDTLRGAATVDEALQKVYGFDIEGFEDAWRAAVGAPARLGDRAKSTPTRVPTEVPTFAPAVIAQTGPTLAPTRARPTPTPLVVVPTAAPPVAASTPATESTNYLPVIVIVTGVVIVATILGLLIIGRRKPRMDA
jgi:hypothetical protein